jgi:hypothetical protein
MKDSNMSILGTFLAPRPVIPIVPVVAPWWWSAKPTGPRCAPWTRKVIVKNAAIKLLVDSKKSIFPYPKEAVEKERV